jgi:AraC-like DNA-binding protein
MQLSPKQFDVLVNSLSSGRIVSIDAGSEDKDGNTASHIDMMPSHNEKGASYDMQRSEVLELILKGLNKNERMVVLGQLVPGADAGRLRMAQEQVRHASRPDLLHQVRCALRRLLLQDQHSGDQVAQMLAMHRRTLNRRLKARGTTFQEVLDDVRFGVARELLSMSEISLDDVAATLGYAGVSSFLRTFYRWTGTTPGRWRRTTAGASSPRPRAAASRQPQGQAASA